MLARVDEIYAVSGLIVQIRTIVNSVGIYQGTARDCTICKAGCASVLVIMTKHVIICEYCTSALSVNITVGDNTIDALTYIKQLHTDIIFAHETAIRMIVGLNIVYRPTRSLFTQSTCVACGLYGQTNACMHGRDVNGMPIYIVNICARCNARMYTVMRGLWLMMFVCRRATRLMVIHDDVKPRCYRIIKKVLAWNVGIAL